MAFLTASPLTHVGLQASGGDSGGDPFESISGFFESSTWGLMKFIFVAFALCLYVALIWWTYQDARRRSDNGGFVMFVTALAVVIPFLGPLIYLVIRPPEFLLDVRERELELIALERRLGDIGDHEGQEIVGRILGRGPGGSSAATQAALREAGVASREELQDLDLRLTELEYRLRRTSGGIDSGSPGVRSSRRPSDAEPRPTAGDPDDPNRTTIRRMRRTVRTDPEASS